MIKLLAVSILLVLGGSITASFPDTSSSRNEDLEKQRRWYEDELRKVLKPIRAEYRKRLKKLRQEFVKKEDYNGVCEVQVLLKELGLAESRHPFSAFSGTWQLLASDGNRHEWTIDGDGNVTVKSKGAPVPYKGKLTPRAGRAVLEAGGNEERLRLVFKECLTVEIWNKDGKRTGWTAWGPRKPKPGR